jgi:KaiC/GvpD/RAD55 family RecA-like ATPase
MVTLDLQQKFFHVIIENPIYLEKVDHSFFDNSDVSLLFKVAKSFIKKYPEHSPTKDQLIHILDKRGLLERLPEDRIDLIYHSKNREYDKEWYIKSLEGWIQAKSLENGLQSAVEYYRSQELNEENIQHVCSNVVNIVNDRGLVSFHKNTGLDFFDPESHYYDESANRHKIGLEFFDKVTEGGIGAGELWCGVGETNVGKSVWLCNIAKSLVENGANVLYISCEMHKKKVVRRIGSNMYNVPMKDYFQLAKDPQYIKKKMQEYKDGMMFNLSSSGNLGSLIIEQFPTSSLDVPTLQNFIKDNVEKVYKRKIDVVVIDYINIMSNFRNPNSENTYMKIKQLAEDIRGMAVRLDLGVITVTQLKVGSYNSTDFNLEDASESSGLGHTLDFGFGIMQDTLMHTNRKYKIKVLKNRDSGYKNTFQMFDVDYDYMRITQSLSDNAYE